MSASNTSRLKLGSASAEDDPSPSENAESAMARAIYQSSQQLTSGPNPPGGEQIVSEELSSPAAAVSPISNKPVKEKEKKSMLSQALQKANVAVGYDNGQDYKSAIAAYGEACDYLSRVMSRTSNEEDRRKLKAIRSTYLTRGRELKHLSAQILNENINGTHSVGSLHNHDHDLDQDFGDRTLGNTQALYEVNEIRSDIYNRDPPRSSNPDYLDLHSEARFPQFEALEVKEQQEAEPSTNTWQTAGGITSNARADLEMLVETNRSHLPMYARGVTALAFHSTGNSAGGSLTERHTGDRLHSDSYDTEMETNAALGAASDVYADRLEPNRGGRFVTSDSNQGLPLDKCSFENLPLETYDSSLEEDAAAEDYALEQNKALHYEGSHVGESDEDERMLEEITREFMLDNHALDAQAKSALRNGSASSRSTQSDESVSALEENILPDVLSHSGASGTLTDGVMSPSQSGSTAIHHFPVQLRLPSTTFAKTSGSNAPAQIKRDMSNSSVQDRRPSAHKIKKLQIRTAAGGRTDTQLATNFVAGYEALELEQSLSKTSSISLDTCSSSPNQNVLESTGTNVIPDPIDVAHSRSRPLVLAPISSGAGPEANLPYATNDVFNSVLLGPERRQSDQDAILHTTSMRGRPTSMRNSQDMFYPSHSSRNSVGVTPTSEKHVIRSMLPLSAEPATLVNEMFENYKLPKSRSSQLRGSQSIRPLEPCPLSLLARPFWLLRCVFETVSHSRGGYLTTRLFVPREVWNMKNVKLKAIEDKIAVCHMLIPVLLRLRAIDLLDTDSLLDEMQSLELIMTEAQTSLAKKLGGDIGPQGISGLFKDAPQQAFATALPEKTDFAGSFSSLDTAGYNPGGINLSKGIGKSSYLSSWRKLRNRTSTPSLAASITKNTEPPTDSTTMLTLPMASGESNEFESGDTAWSHRGQLLNCNTTEVTSCGPNAGYVAALSKLCDAVQVLDGIVYQIESPIHRNSSPTHVGLELCTRRASEFFGLYICRFIIQDLTLLMDKFVDRAANWVSL